MYRCTIVRQRIVQNFVVSHRVERKKHNAVRQNCLRETFLRRNKSWENSQFEVGCRTQARTERARAVRHETQHSTCALRYVICARCTWDVFLSVPLLGLEMLGEDAAALRAVYCFFVVHFFVYLFLFARSAYFFVFASAKFGLQANIGEEYAHFRQCEEDLGSEVVFWMDDELSIESGPLWFDVAHVHDHSPLPISLRGYRAIFLFTALSGWKTHDSIISVLFPLFTFGHSSLRPWRNSATMFSLVVRTLSWTRLGFWACTVEKYVVARAGIMPTQHHCRRQMLMLCRSVVPSAPASALAVESTGAFTVDTSSVYTRRWWRDSHRCLGEVQQWWR